MKDEGFGWKNGNWGEAAGWMVDDEQSSSDQGRGGEKVPEGVEQRAESVGCVRQMRMLEEGKRRIVVGDGGRGGGGGRRLFVVVTVVVGADRVVDAEGWQHLGAICWWCLEREEVDD